MNKILVSRDNIITDSSNIMINDREIIIKKSGIYSLEYNDIDDIRY